MDAGKKESWLKLSGNKGISKIATLIILFVAINTLFFCLLAKDIWKYGHEEFDTPHADFVIVLGATSHGHEPSPVFRERILEAVRLYHNGLAKKIIFTGQPGSPPQAIVGKTYALKNGVPESDILTEEKSTNTLENLWYATRLLPSSNPWTVLIVSDPLHLKRAMAMAKDLGLKAHPAPTSSSQIQSVFHRIKFLIRETLAYSYYQLKKEFSPEDYLEPAARK